MKTCRKCGGTEFYKSGHCKPCHKKRCAIHYQNNAEQIIARVAKQTIPEEKRNYDFIYRAKNRKDRKKYHNAWVAKNPTYNAEWRALHPEYDAQWRAKNPHAKRIGSQNRRAKIRATGGRLSKNIASKLYVLQKGICACGCQQPLGNDYHLDHRTPIALGGTNTDDNMQLLTSTCNLQKGKKHPIEFMQQKGFLL